MTTQDPAVRLEAIAAAAGLALFTLRRAVSAGKIPPADITLPGTPQPIHAWKLSTLHSWNPAIADRCAALLRALEAIPLDPELSTSAMLAMFRKEAHRHDRR